MEGSITESIWHFTIGGVRKGPASLEQVQDLLSKGRLDPEVDLVWKMGMDEWATVGSVPELAEVTVDKVPPVSPPPAQFKPLVVPEVINPYEAPNAGASTSELRAAMEERRGAYKGMGRFGYFIMLLVPTWGMLIFFFLQPNHPVFHSGAADDASIIAPMLFLAIVLVYCLYSRLSRLKNLGMSRWNLLWMFVPVMSLWIGYRMFACPAGYADHKQKDLIGKILTWVYFGPYLLAIALIIASVFIGAWQPR